MYKVISLFADLQDKNHVYNVGDVFPRAGLAVTDERLAELSGCKNKQGVPLIEKVEDESDKRSEEEAPAEETPTEETPTEETPGEEAPAEPVKKAAKKAAEK